MNILQRLWLKATQAVIPNPIFAAMSGQYGFEQPQHMSPNYGTWAKEGFRNDTLYKCISYLSRNASLVEWGLYTDRFKREEIETHPILDLWHSPNPDQYLADFVEDWAGTLLLGGNGFIKSEYIKQSFNFNTPPDALYVLRPDWVDVIPNEYGIVGYQFGENAYNMTPVPPFQIAHTKYWNPADALRGFSPIQVAAIFIDLQSSGNRWNLALMQNSARPSGAWTTDQMLGKTALDVMKSDLQKKYSGLQNAGTPPVLYGGLKWQNMSITPAELDWLGSRLRNAVDIANIYNLDPTLVGDSTASTMNNKEQAKLASYFEAIFPMVLNKLQATANRWLVPKFGDPSLYLGYKPESVPAIQKVIQDQLAAQSDRSTKIWMAGKCTLDEARELDGLDDLPNGAGQVHRIGGVLVRVEDLQKYAEQALQKPAAPPMAVPENELDNPPVPTPQGKPNDANNNKSGGNADHRLLPPPSNPIPEKTVKALDANNVYQPDDLDSQLDAYRHAGATYLTWYTAQGNVCDVCKENDGATVEVGMPFPNGSILPPRHPNCNCSVEPFAEYVLKRNSGDVSYKQALEQIDRPSKERYRELLRRAKV
jgi:HK97 family phage portal protein